MKDRDDSWLGVIHMKDRKNKSGTIPFIKRHVAIILATCLIGSGAIGAGLKYLEEDARTQQKLQVKDRNIISSVNPFIAPPTPTPTPQLSKEYIYAGSRLLAVEDANASVAQPADLAVWRPSSGVWYILTNFSTQAWGVAGDVPVPGDYDGDGKTDFSVFRPSTSTWYIVYSSTGSLINFTFGQSGDIPAPADFDGDGKTDAVVFRPDEPSSGLGTWYIRRSSDLAQQTQQYGLSTDTPAPADYDGDGKADFGVWRSSNTAFYSTNSGSSTLNTIAFSLAGDKVVSADFDGDGKADYAVYDTASAAWHIRSSQSSTIATSIWGSGGDVPVQNDFDGDGKVDLAAWRDSNGTWYICQSSKLGITGQTPSTGNPYPNELRQTQWGQSGDIPVASFWRR